MKSLDELLTDNTDAAAEESAPVEEQPTEAAPEPDETKSEGDEPAAEASEESPGEKPVKDSSPESETSVPITALHGERDRRQAAERELQQLRQQLESQVEPKEPTSVFEDENQFVAELEQRFQGELVNRTLNESQFHAEQKYGADVLAEKVETFKELVTKNPAYAEQFASSISPYFTLVDIVDNHTELEAMQDIDAYKAKVRAEVLRELEAEKKQKSDLRDSIPESLVGDDSKGGLKGSAWSGPTPLESIID